MTAHVQYPAYVEPLAPAVEEASVASWVQPQQPPISHIRFVAEATGRTSGFLSQSVIPDIGPIFQQAPIKHHRHPGLTQCHSQPFDDSLLFPEEIYHDKWAQPHFPPVHHEPYRPASSSVSGTYPQLLEEETQVWWVQPQHPPVKHRRHQGETRSTGYGLDLFESTSNIAWAQPQALPQPIHHKEPWVDQYVRGPDETEFAGAFDTATFPFPVHHPPVLHRRFESSSFAVGGFYPQLLEEFTQNPVWVQPNLPPSRHRLYQAATKVESGFEESTFTALDVANGFPWPVHQAPIKHRRHQGLTGATSGHDLALFEIVTYARWEPPQQPPVDHRRYPGSGGVSEAGIDPSLLEAFTQNLAWAQPQSPPHPLKKREPWRDWYARGPDETEFTGEVFDPINVPWPPQNPPIPHRRFVAEVTRSTGFGLDIIPTIDPAEFAWPAQQSPVAHRRYQGLTVLIHPTRWLEFETWNETGSGGVIFGGSAAPALTYNITATGSVVFSGTAHVSHSIVETGTGTIIFTGSGIEFTIYFGENVHISEVTATLLNFVQARWFVIGYIEAEEII